LYLLGKRHFCTFGTYLILRPSALMIFGISPDTSAV
jgi:hypothetical protein